MKAAPEFQMFGVSFQGLPEVIFGVILSAALVLSTAAFLWNLGQWATPQNIHGCGGESPALRQRQLAITQSGAAFAGVVVVCILTGLVLQLKNG